MARPFAIDPAKWPKILQQLDAGESPGALAEAHGVSVAAIHGIRKRSADGAPKANGKRKTRKARGASTNGAKRKLLTQAGSNEVVMPTIMEWISALYKAQHDPADRPRLQQANAAIVKLAADIQAEL